MTHIQQRKCTLKCGCCVIMQQVVQQITHMLHNDSKMDMCKSFVQGYVCFQELFLTCCFIWNHQYFIRTRDIITFIKHVSARQAETQLCIQNGLYLQYLKDPHYNVFKCKEHYQCTPHVIQVYILTEERASILTGINKV